MVQATVVILAWNNLEYLKRFLPTLVDYTPADEALVMVADNGSSDGSVAWIKVNFPKVSVLPLDRNHGFTGGYIRALKEVGTPLAVLLNSDIEVKRGWLKPLLLTMQDPLIGAAMPKILSHADPAKFEYAGASGGMIDRYGYPFCRGRVFAHLEHDHGQYNKPCQVFWASGACMMVRMDAYHKAGGLDERFFAHMEEIDLCWRIHRSGYQVWVNPESEVLHVGGGSLPNEHPHKIFYNFRNSLLMLRKNLSRVDRRGILWMRMILDGVAAFKYLLNGKVTLALAILKAHAGYYQLRRNYPEPEHRIKLREIPGYYPFSTVWRYFVRGTKTYDKLVVKGD